MNYTVLDVTKLETNRTGLCTLFLDIAVNYFRWAMQINNSNFVLLKLIIIIH